MRRSLSAMVLASAIAVVAGCGNPAPTVTNGPTLAPTPRPSAVSSETSRHVAPELEALLPETLNGTVLTRESQRGTDLSRNSEALAAVLGGMGKTLEDFTIASAYSAGGDLEAQIGLWRIAGADHSKLVPGFIDAVQGSSTTKLTISHADIGGHAVTQVGASGELTQGPLYAYAKDDMILFVQTTDPALAAQAMALLP
jgi:hypothetical protein